MKINGYKTASTGGNIIYHNLEAGEHIITKADVNNLFYIDLVTAGSKIHQHIYTINDNMIHDLCGRKHQLSTNKNSIYIMGNKKHLEY